MRIGKYPAEIVAYNAAKRAATFRIDGLTEGDKDLPEGELFYPLGDKSHHTEIEIKTGDKVWVEFIGGDERYPLIVGYRVMDVGNDIAWRRWHHQNIELNADEDLVINCANLKINASGTTTISSAGGNTINGGTTNNGGMKNSGGMENEGGLASKGDTALSEGGLTLDGNAYDEHVHRYDNGYTDVPTY